MAVHTPDPAAPRSETFGAVINPMAARGRGRRTAARVLREFARRGVPVEVIVGESVQHSRDLVRRRAEQGLRGLVLIGGDGLIGLLLQEPSVRALPIGIIPAGSGNDFARQLQIPRNPRSAVQRLLTTEAAPRRIDLGCISTPLTPEHWFAGGLSVGFDARVNSRANRVRLPLGPLRYFIGLFAELIHLRPLDITVTRDGQTQKFRGLLASVMNIRTLGGGIPISPESDVEDGALDLIEVSSVVRRRFLSVLGVLARGRHGSLPEVRMSRVESVTIDAGDEIAYADGDEVGTGPFEVRVAPGALTVLA